MKSFAGIGSRETPQECLEILRDACEYLANKGYILRSGGADGADSWCEKGCDLANGEKEIYLPWKGFNYNNSNLYLENLKNYEQAKEIAAKYHPAWGRLRESVKLLMGRNCHQILGKSLDNPVKFVLCYCVVKNGEFMGGTGQACRHAKDLNIPIFNLFLEEDKNKIKAKIYERIHRKTY